MIEKIVNLIKNPKNPAIIILYILTIFVISISYFIMGDSLLVVVESNSSIVNRLLISGYAFFYFTVYSFLFIFVLKTLFFLLKKIKIPFTEKINNFLLISFISTILILTFIDQQVYALLGVHINSPIFISTLPKLKKDANLGPNNYIFIIVILLIISLFTFFLYKILKKYIQTIPIILNFILFTVFIITSFVISKKSSKLEIIWLYMLNKSNHLAETITLDYNPNKTITLNKKKDILFIVTESLRSDMLNDEIFPNLTKYVSKNRCSISKKHYSSTHTTVKSIFSIIYSLHSYYYLVFEKDYLKKRYINSYILNTLKQNSYDIYGAFASTVNYDSNLITQNFDFVKEFESNNIILEKEYQYDEVIMDWLKKNYQERDKTKSLLFFVFFDSTHFAYNYPKMFEKFKPVIDLEKKIVLKSSLATKEKKNELFNRYKNSAFYVDSMIGELLDMFKEQIESNELIVVFTGDHGEEFWEFGGYGHAATSFYNPRIQVPLVICLPDIEDKEIKLSSHIDIFPTIIDYLGGDLNILSQFTSGKSLLKNSDNRYVITSGHSFPLFEKKTALISLNGKLWLEKISDSIDKINEFLILKTTDINDIEINEISIDLKNQLDDFKKNEFSRFLKKSK